MIHRRVSGDHPNLVGPEVTAQREELLADEGLDRRGVKAALALTQRHEVKGKRDQRFAASGRGREDDVVPREELQDRLLLGVIELDPQTPHVPEEEVEQLFGSASARTRRNAIRKREGRVGHRCEPVIALPEASLSRYAGVASLSFCRASICSSVRRAS